MSLDSPAREQVIRDVLARKPALRAYYSAVYARYRAVLDRCPTEGLALELGSGGGFADQVIPEIITSDVIAYPGVQQQIDATAMPFADGGLRFIGMHNTFHHIPDVATFLHEAARCLCIGGRLLIVDQYPGLFAAWIYEHLHHEPFDRHAETWAFASRGPLSDANGALAWIVFVRDRQRFAATYRSLAISAVTPHSPLCYWLTGGLRHYGLLPGWAYSPAAWLDRALIRFSPRLGSFMDVEVVKTSTPP